MGEVVLAVVLDLLQVAQEVVQEAVQEVVLVVPHFMQELVQVVPEVELVLELELVLVHVVLVQVQVALDLVQEADFTTLLRTTLLRSLEGQADDTMPLLIAEEGLLNLAPVRANRTYVRIGEYDFSIQPNEISKEHLHLLP